MFMRLYIGWRLPAAMLAVVLFSSCTTRHVLSQANETAGVDAGAKVPAYEVVSIKLADPGDRNVKWEPLANGFDFENLPLEPLIHEAYGVHFDNQISGLPEWARTDRYNVSARADEETVETWKKLSSKELDKQKQIMLQTLFAGRFQLKIRREIKKLPVYDLVIAKGGLKIKEAASDEKESFHMYMAGSNITITDQASDIGGLGQSLSNHAGRLIVDKTGLGDKKFDIKLQYSRNDQTTPDAGDESPSLFTALEEQLGLQLVPAKEPVDTFVVEHIERPSAN